MTDFKISFIGAGNMGRAMIAGLLNNGFVAENISISNPSQQKLDILAEQFGVQTTTDNQAVCAQADVIVFTVKPQILPSVIAEIQATLPENMLLISVAAGVTVKNMQSLLNKNFAIVRSMPNVAATVGSSATALYATDDTSQAMRDRAEMIMRAIGVATWVNSEAEVDIATALAGSGPAYFYLIMQALQEQAVTLGLTEETAELLMAQTIVGAGHLALQSESPIAQLLQSVISPKGTTASALDVLYDANVPQSFKEALTAAAKRAAELATAGK